MAETDTWPMASGDYVLGNEASSVAVLIVGRGAVEVPPDLYCIKGILKTENIGLERVIGHLLPLRHLEPAHLLHDLLQSGDLHQLTVDQKLLALVQRQPGVAIDALEFGILAHLSP